MMINIIIFTVTVGLTTISTTFDSHATMEACNQEARAIQAAYWAEGITAFVECTQDDN